MKPSHPVISHGSSMDVAKAERAIVSLCILLMQDLQIQCEAQVLLFVLDYIDGTQLEPAVAAQLFQHVSSLTHAHSVGLCHCKSLSGVMHITCTFEHTL